MKFLYSLYYANTETLMDILIEKRPSFSHVIYREREKERKSWIYRDRESEIWIFQPTLEVKAGKEELVWKEAMPRRGAVGVQ